MKWHRAVAILATSVGPWLVNAVEEGLNGDYVDRCPKACSELGADPSTWPQVHKIEDLKGCDEPVLLSFNVQNLLTEPTTQITIQTCSRAASQSFGSAIAVNKDVQGGPSIANNCGAKTNRVNATAQLADLSSVVGELAKYVEDGAACGTTIIFAKSGSAVLGLYAGADVFTPTLAATINQFGEEAQSGKFVLQVCKANSTTATTIGLVAGDIADLSKIQDTVKTWANNQCLSDNKDSSSSKIGVQIGLLTSTAGGNSTTLAARRPHLDRRADCRDIQVISGDGCASLASKCGISGDDFTKYNPKTDLCSTLMPKQYVCCSAGTLPDHTPQPGSDGSCYEYTVQEGDGCWAIGDAFGIDQTAIENYNKQTWGWGGCGALQKGQKICLSKGSPPFPDSVEGVTCGPTVPGTEKPTDGTNWADLNPCPLNSCCDVWGFCGTTAEFCTPTPADTGAPGTAKPGTNGCISNCGMDIVNNGSPPSTFRKVAYFEGWNGARPCLTMDASQIDSGEYNTVHFAFATLAADWSVTIEDESKKQFEAFKNLKNVKKVLSFGGWTFSTDPATFQRFRDATTSANRNTVAANAVNFMKDNGLDGLDFDWEYPGAPDIPGIPAGSTAEGLNYMKFLTVVKNQLPSGATLSIALPASYWYLKQYPVNLMQSVVDYFVYMTYDFHGQWDVDSKWSVEGCETGNCVRSHINKTETKNAMVMITKAGVTANKIVIGVSSYARSFRLSDPGCLGVMCKYQGDKNHSEAYQGKCTGTSGYISNAELEEIKAGKSSYPNVKYFFDQDSESDILVYGTSSSVDWAAYMSADTKKSRASWVSGLNFGGTTDWALGPG
ncbi:glycoside hydrolase [Thozetella sp. PMI_491]|nr:glycoside hydrolase [Thozetella sp. PMI_491]